MFDVTYMKTVNIHEAKTHLSRLLDEVSHGEEVVIAKAGRPIARLAPMTPTHPARTPGFLREGIRISDDFDAPLPDDLRRRFEGPDA